MRCELMSAMSRMTLYARRMFEREKGVEVADVAGEFSERGATPVTLTLRFKRATLEHDPPLIMQAMLEVPECSLCKELSKIAREN